MELNDDEIKRIYFLTRTALTKEQIVRMAHNFSDFFKLIEEINYMKKFDKDRDWIVFDLDYKNRRLVYGASMKLG